MGPKALLKIEKQVKNLANKYHCNAQIDENLQLKFCLGSPMLKTTWLCHFIVESTFHPFELLLKWLSGSPGDLLDKSNLNSSSASIALWWSYNDFIVLRCFFNLIYLENSILNMFSKLSKLFFYQPFGYPKQNLG